MVIEAITNRTTTYILPSRQLSPRKMTGRAVAICLDLCRSCKAVAISRMQPLVIRFGGTIRIRNSPRHLENPLCGHYPFMHCAFYPDGDAHLLVFGAPPTPRQE